LHQAGTPRKSRPQPWRELPGEPLCVELDKEAGGGVGLSLAGNRDRRALGVFVAGLRPGGTSCGGAPVRATYALWALCGRSTTRFFTDGATATPRPSSGAPPPKSNWSCSGNGSLSPLKRPRRHVDDVDPASQGPRRHRADGAPALPSVSPPAGDPVVTVTGLALPTGSPASRDPSTCPVLPGRETTLEIRKGRLGLGLSVAGGADTQLVSPIFLFTPLALWTPVLDAIRSATWLDPYLHVHFTFRAVVILEVYDEGAAAKDGRLLPGDRILEVRAHASEAVAALRRPCSKVAVKVARRAETDAGWSGSARPRGLGFSVAGKRSALQYSSSVFARVALSLHYLRVFPSGGRPRLHRHDPTPRRRRQHAAAQGACVRAGEGALKCASDSDDWRVRVQVGDRIVSINGRSLDALSHRDVVGVLKEASGNVCLQVVADTNVAAILSRMQNLSSGASAFLPPVDWWCPRSSSC
uniref:PDZ domain-containing protein n=1 Tax=Hippocampus comes TaxID=109280 RepID=A0A3Q2Z971_HIPCM